jgi:hypothetical protein
MVSHLIGCVPPKSSPDESPLERLLEASRKEEIVAIREITRIRVGWHRDQKGRSGEEGRRYVRHNRRLEVKARRGESTGKDGDDRGREGIPRIRRSSRRRQVAARRPFDLNLFWLYRLVVSRALSTIFLWYSLSSTAPSLTIG